MTNVLRIRARFSPTIQQRGIIAMLTGDPKAEISYVLKFGFLVVPKIDLRRLERTFAKLADRHDALRQTFEREGDEWFVNVWDRHRTGLIVEDHGDISDSEFSALLQHHSSIPIRLLDDVLFQVVVLRCGRRGDVLLVRCHHAIADAHSMVIVTEDWLNLLIGIPLLGKGITHEDYLSQYSNQSARQRSENLEYWNRLLFPALPSPEPSTFGKPGTWPRLILQVDTIRSIRASVNRTEFDEIPVATNARSQTPFSIILAAFADTIIEVSGLPGIYVHTPVDRTSSKLRNYVGCAMSVPVLRCHAANGAPLAEYASTLASQLKQSLVHLPSEAAVYESTFDLAVHRAGGLLRHFNCSAAYAEGRARKSPFSPSIMSASETPRKIGPLTITRIKIATIDYCLNGLALRIFAFADHVDFEIKYHSHFYSEKYVEALRAAMQEKLHIRLTD